MSMAVDQPIVDIQSLHFRWQAGLADILHIPRLTIQAGERVFLAGQSGSGKSTLLSLLAGVMLPQQGQINILGQQLHTMRDSRRDHFRADHIGFVFQMFNLIPYLSLVENVTLPLHFSKHRRARVDGDPAREALRLLNALGLNEPQLLSRPVTELSVGQQQRVAAARALIGAPALLIADEPTSALDRRHRQSFIELLFDECERQGSSLLFVSHDEQLGELFERRIDMRQINQAHAEAD